MTFYSSWLFYQYNTAVWGLDSCKICQVSMDGWSVHHKLVKKVQGKVVGNEQPALIDIGNCGLHTVYGIFISGVETERDP